MGTFGKTMLDAKTNISNKCMRKLFYFRYTLLMSYCAFSVIRLN